MKVLTLALLLSLPGALTPHKPLRQPTTQMTKRTKGGRWYFAATGHAVYCYGPVMGTVWAITAQLPLEMSSG